jgi:hypothetical protein
MMGPSHALSGASAWLAGCWALDHFASYEQTPLAVAVGAVVCAGAALLDAQLAAPAGRPRSPDFRQPRGQIASA